MTRDENDKQWVETYFENFENPIKKAEIKTL